MQLPKLHETGSLQKGKSEIKAGMIKVPYAFVSHLTCVHMPSLAYEALDTLSAETKVSYEFCTLLVSTRTDEISNAPVLDE